MYLHFDCFFCVCVVFGLFDSFRSFINKVMFMQTLPRMVQACVLSFLAYEHKRFCARDLSRLAGNVLRDDQGPDFWVKTAARNLLDALCKLKYEWISGLSLDSEEEGMDEEFESVPDWLREVAGASDVFLPWLPISPDDLTSRSFVGSAE